MTHSSESDRVTPELLATMVDLLPTIGSLRDLSGLTGLRLDTVRRTVAPFLAIMKLQGTHPKCGCGKDRFHQYGCKEVYAKGAHDDCYPGHTKAQTAILQVRREAIIDAIMTGDSYSDIEARLGLSHKSARKYLRFLSPEQVAHRKRLEKARMAKASDTRPFRDPIYARIASAVPRWVTDATRDDIISEMYVAIREGTLREDDIEANAKRFASKAVSMWEGKFGPRSLDVPLFEDGKATLGDIIPDPSALAAFDALDDLRLGRRHPFKEAY